MSHSGRSRLGRGGGRSGKSIHGSGDHSTSPASSSPRLPVLRPNDGGSSGNTRIPNFESWNAESQNNEGGNEGFSTQQEIPSTQFTIDDLLANLDRERDLPKLDPFPSEGTTWFDRDRESKISRHISNIIRSGYNGVYLSWTKTPPAVRDQFFVKFAQIYYWNAALTHTVRTEFDKVGISRMKGITTQIKKAGKCPGWMNQSVYLALCEHWASEVAQAKSQKTRAARYSDRDGCGPHKHVSGQKSFYRVQCELEEELGRPATISDVFTKTHTKSSDGTFVDLKAKQIADTFEQKKSEFMQSQMDSNTDISDGASQTVQLTPEQENELFLQSNLPDHRGNVYGLGNLSMKFRQGKNKGLADSTVTDTISQLQQELVSHKQEMASYKDNIAFLTQQNRELLQYLQATLPSFPTHLATTPPPPARNDGAGSSDATQPPDHYPNSFPPNY